MMSNGARGWGGGELGRDLWVVGESDGVSGRSNQPNKVSVVISELKFGAIAPLHPLSKIPGSAPVSH